MKPRYFLVLLLLSIFSSSQAQDGFWECPLSYSRENTILTVYNWATYIAEDTIANFEALCDVTIVYDTFSEDSEMLEVLRAGNAPHYDVVVPIDSTMYLLLAEGLLQELDYSLIPNRANLAQTFLNRANTFDPNNAHSVPYLWGTTGIGYNRTRLGREITSFDEMFNATDARVAWIDYDRLMLGIALNQLGLDPSTSNPAFLAQARDYLIAHSANLSVIADDTGQDLLFENQVDMVVEYSGDVFQIIDQCRCEDFAYTVPSEGTITDMTSLAIPNGAANTELAHIFIDYLLDKQVSADIANFTVYGTPNRLSVEEGLIYQEYLNDPAIYPPDEILVRLFVLVADSSIETLYADTWAEVRAAVGK